MRSTIWSQLRIDTSTSTVPARSNRSRSGTSSPAFRPPDSWSSMTCMPSGAKRVVPDGIGMLVVCSMPPPSPVPMSVIFPALVEVAPSSSSSSPRFSIVR
jgi:hypothetical protein